MTEPRVHDASDGQVLASVVISTYNRCNALPATLDALATQTAPAEDYEVLVVDDGSSDDTPRVLAEMSLPCALHVHRLPENRGVSAARNVGIRHAQGKYLILLSDDVLVPEDFIAAHIETIDQYPGTWVVGSFEQLATLTKTPFGRYLDNLERKFEAARKVRQLGPQLWELSVPTARNLSLPRADLERIGLFDERFRVTCEDQDLAHRASEIGVRFVYSAAIRAVHNDQSANLRSYCRFQQRGARDTVLLCLKYPGHRGAEVVRVNGYVERRDGPRLIAKKLLKLVLARPSPMWLVERAIRVAEFARLPDPLLGRAYRGLIGLYTFRGWREGLVRMDSEHSDAPTDSLGAGLVSQRWRGDRPSSSGSTLLPSRRR
jgi:GT2 family glycosyltransferase